MSTSKSEKYRKRLEQCTSETLLQIIKDNDMNENQKIQTIKRIFKKRIEPLLKDYCDFGKTSNTDLISGFKKKYSIPISKPYSHLKTAINNFYNAILTAKKMNTDKKKNKISECAIEIKYLTDEKAIEENAKAKLIPTIDTLLEIQEIQSEVFKLSKCLKDMESEVKKVSNSYSNEENTLEEYNLKNITSQVEQAIAKREDSINGLILFQNRINILNISLKSKQAQQEKDFSIPKVKTKIQHYIPQFYQRNWQDVIADNIGKDTEFKRVYQYIKKSDEFTITTIKNCCQEQNLYEASKKHSTNYFEKQYSKIEGEISSQIQSLISILKNISLFYPYEYRNSLLLSTSVTDEEKNMLIKFLSHLSARHPDSVYKNSKHMSANYSLTEEQKKIHSYDKLTETERTKLKYNYLALENNSLEKKLKEQGYKIQILVSDEPKIFYCNAITSKLVTKDDEYFLPLSPTILVWFTKNIFITDKKVCPLNNETYKKFVKTYFNNDTVVEIYGIEKKYIKAIKKIAKS
jgi:hypothetical protein